MISMNDEGNSITARFTATVILPFLFLIALALLFPPQIASAQEDLAVLFLDDFEDGFADGWELGLGWWIDREPTGNYSLMGEGHSWATPPTVGWVDYVIEARVKLIQDGFHLNFRMSEHIDPEHLPALETLYNVMDRSTRSDERFLAAKRLIQTLISIASGNVAESRLLQNYPNPFNPDTWIPYQLAEPGNATIGIYNVSGQLMRKLDLGYKVPGFYTGKRRSAYWDGNNDYGEQVSSGVYFYTIYSTSPAAEFTAARKMILMK